MDQHCENVAPLLSMTGKGIQNHKDVKTRKVRVSWRYLHDAKNQNCRDWQNGKYHQNQQKGGRGDGNEITANYWRGSNFIWPNICRYLLGQTLNTVEKLMLDSLSDRFDYYKLHDVTRYCSEVMSRRKRNLISSTIILLFKIFQTGHCRMICSTLCNEYKQVASDISLMKCHHLKQYQCVSTFILTELWLVVTHQGKAFST